MFRCLRNPVDDFLMRLQCRGASDMVVHEAVIVIRSREIYRLDLQSTPDRLSQDRRQLEVIDPLGWRWGRQFASSMPPRQGPASRRQAPARVARWRAGAAW